MEIKNRINEKTNQLEKIIKKYLPKEEGLQQIIMEAMNYSVLSGGKRLRPMLMYETYQMFGGHSNVIEPFLAAIEMIHTYSLVHDDLPAMDDDDYRRGRHTTHVVFGEAMGVLAGDALLNYAFETALLAFQETEYRDQTVKALQVLAKKAGIYGMIGGQVVDVQNENNPNIQGDTLKFIYELKTGALIEASMLIGGILADAGWEELECLQKIAWNVGMAFQIQDDVLDVTSTLEELGKPIGSDDKNQKVTYVSCYGLNAARERVKELTQDALDGLEKLPVKNEFLKQLLLYLIDRRS